MFYPLFRRSLILAATLLLIAAAVPQLSSSELAEDGKLVYRLDPATARLMETKIGDSLVPLLASFESIPVIISLVDQPIFEISQEVQGRYWNQLRANEEEIRGINRKYSTDRRPASPEEAASIARAESASISPGDRQRIRRINERSKALKDEMRREILNRARLVVGPDQSVVVNLIQSLGGTISYTFEIENAISAQVSGMAIQAIANHPLVRYVVEDEAEPANLNVSAPTIMAEIFWNAGETGGIWWNATCDSGVDTTHPALSGKTWWQGVFHDTAVGASNYNEPKPPNVPSTDDLQGHGTHVAGIANSTDATNRGISFGSTRSTNLKAGYRGTDGGAWMYHSDGMASVHWGFSNAIMDVINLSYGGEATDDDHGWVRFWDAVVDAKNTIATISAGNSGAGTNKLGRPSLSWNSICVANVDDRGTANRDDDIIWTSSSRGPTPGGRKKPDISAPGRLINAPAHNWEGTNPDFVSMTGTSMAAPHVAGAATLLHDVGIHDPRTIKAVLINTADFIQGATTWTNEYGWGYLNLNTSYLRRTNWFLHSVTPRTGGSYNTPGSFRLYRVPSPQSGDKATLVWNRHVNYNNAEFPTTYHTLNDLDLRFYRESNNNSHAYSTSSIDNVEQVVSSTTDPLVIRAYAYSTTYSVGSSETYALAVPPGTVAANGPGLSPNSYYTSYTPPLNSKFLVQVRLTNIGDLHAHGCVLSIGLPAGVTLISGSLSNSLGTVTSSSSSGWVDLWLKATTSGAKTVTLSATSNSYGISSWSGSGSFTVDPGAADTVAPYSALLIGQPTYQGSGTDRLANGGFESDFAGWTTSGTAAIDPFVYRSGVKSLKLGSGAGSAYQSVSIASGAGNAFLTFWYRSSAGIFASVGCQIRDNSGNLLVQPFITSSSQSSWTKVTADVSRFKGQTIRVYFYSSGSFLGNSTLWLDDVTLKENENVWVRPANLHSIANRDDNAGIDYSEYNIAGTGWNTYSTPFGMSGRPEGWNSLTYRSMDNGANLEPTISTGINLDSEAPKSVLRVAGTRTFSGGTERVSNGGFESNLTGWTTSGAVSAVTSPVYSGSRAAKVGETGAGSIYQDVSVQSGASRAIASVRVRSVQGSGSTYAAIYLIDPVTGLTLTSIGWNLDWDWTDFTWDVTRLRGSTVRLKFDVVVNSGAASTLYVDEVTLRQNSNLYVLPTSTMYIHSAERSGVQTYESKIDAGSYTPGQSFTVPTPGIRTVAYRALDNLGHQESDVITQINVDNTGPTGSISIDGGATSTASLNVTLTLSASDPAGVKDMRIQSDTGVWGGWQAYQTSLAYTFASSSPGTKTLSVQYRDMLGNIGTAYSDSIIYSPPTTMNIPTAKAQPDGQGIRLLQKVVTAIFPAQGCFYIEEPDRSSGIRVRSSTLPSAINIYVDVDGVPATSFAEREILADVVTQYGAAPEIRPIGMPNRSLGGAAFHYQLAVPTGATGLNNVGLLVKSWGRVTSVWAGSFYIDDGSGVSDSAPSATGVLVSTDAIGVTPPAIGQYVDVTGISGVETLSGAPIRVLRPRSAADIRIRQFEAAFVYDSQMSQAQQFKDLLDSQGAATDLVAYSAIGSTNWSKYHLVLIGPDTGFWSDPAMVSAVLGANTPIIGIGSGGTRFFDVVTSPNLFIGWGQSAVGSYTSGTVFGGDIYTFPHDLEVLPGETLQLYASATYTVMLYDPNGVSSRMLRLPGSNDYFPLASEAGRFYQWGYSGSPQYMTQTGKDLFTNVVFRAARP